MYITQIVWILSLPVLLFASYRLVLWALKRYETKAGK